MSDRPMDVETCLDRLRDLALVIADDIADDAVAQQLRDDIKRDHERVDSAIRWAAAMGDAVDASGGDFSNCPLPPRLDLAAGALAVAMGTTTDADVKPWLQTALDFLSGDYEPLESIEAPDEGVATTPASDGEGFSEGEMPTEPKDLSVAPPSQGTDHLPGLGKMVPHPDVSGLVESLKHIIGLDHDEFGEEGPCALFARKALAALQSHKGGEEPLAEPSDPR